MCILIKMGSYSSFIDAIHKTAHYTKGALGVYGIDTSTLKLTKQSNKPCQCLRWKSSGT